MQRSRRSRRQHRPGAGIGYAVSEQWSLQMDAQNLLDE
jgi:hypothetical protein